MPPHPSSPHFPYTTLFRSNPVHRMQLVEIVAARQTSPEVLQRALRFVQQIGKLPVIVKDSPGFLVNRILMPYLIEDRKSTRLNSSHRTISYAVFCLKKKN